MLLDLFTRRPRCVAALEAGVGAHHWVRELRAMGREVGADPPSVDEPFVERHKNGEVDAEAV